jgi:hypothetical protein
MRLADMIRKTPILVLLLFLTPGVVDAAPRHVARHRAPVHRRSVKGEKPAPAVKRVPKPVCQKTVVRVRTGKVLELVPKEHCF